MAITVAFDDGGRSLTSSSIPLSVKYYDAIGYLFTLLRRLLFLCPALRRGLFFSSNKGFSLRSGFLFFLFFSLTFNSVDARNGGGTATGAAADAKRLCQPIEVDACRDLPYNYTAMPNFAGNDDQVDAEVQLSTFQPLIQLHCSPQLKFFLCSVHVPMCTDKVDVPIGPCRPLCEGVRRCCEPMLRQFGFPWPASLNCSKFPPENNAQAMCMKGPGDENGQGKNNDESNGASCSNAIPIFDDHQTNAGKPYSPGDPHHFRPANPDNRALPPTDENKNKNDNTSSTKTCANLPKNIDIDLLKKFEFIAKSNACVPRCGENVIFESDEKRTAAVVSHVATISCFVLCVLAVLCTFFQRSNAQQNSKNGPQTSGVATVENLCSTDRLRYSESAIFFICVCYGLASVGYLIVLCSPDTACVAYNGHSLLVGQGVQRIKCTVVAIILYYFFTASRLWWLFLCSILLICGPLGVRAETVERRSFWLHIVAWGLPVLKVVVVLVRQSVDGDELTGICYVGNQNASDLFSLLVLPEMIYLVVGLAALVAALVLTLNNNFGPTKTCGKKPSNATVSGERDEGETACRHHYQRPNPNLDPSVPSAECDLTCRGILAFLFVVPSSCLLAAYSYEYGNRERWLTAGREKTLNFDAFLVKILAGLSYGILCAGWTLCRRLIGLCSSVSNRLTSRRMKNVTYAWPPNPSTSGQQATNFVDEKQQRDRQDLLAQRNRSTQNHQANVYQQRVAHRQQPKNEFYSQQQQQQRVPLLNGVTQQQTLPFLSQPQQQQQWHEHNHRGGNVVI